MGVYINMDMPKKTYAHCMLIKDIDGSVQLHVCTKNSEEISEWEFYDLVHVPEPHGRLIDADALVEDLKRQCEEVFKIDAVSPDDFWITRDQAYNERLWKTWCESLFEYLKTRETIIPESEEG